MVTPYLLITAGVACYTVTNCPVVVLEGNLEQFDLVSCGPVKFNRADVAWEDTVELLCTQLRTVFTKLSYLSL